MRASSTCSGPSQGPHAQHDARSRDPIEGANDGPAFGVVYVISIPVTPPATSASTMPSASSSDGARNTAMRPIRRISRSVSRWLRSASRHGSEHSRVPGPHAEAPCDTRAVTCSATNPRSSNVPGDRGRRHPGHRRRERCDTKALAMAFAAEQAAVRARIGETPLSELPSLAAWRRVFRGFGVDPTQYRSAAEALLRRLTKQGELPSIGTLVDLANLVSIRHALPVAVFDMAGGQRRHRGSAGQRQRTLGRPRIERDRSPEPGEVIFADEADVVVARRWCWRQSAESAAREGTTHVLVTVEGHHDERLGRRVCGPRRAGAAASGLCRGEPGQPRAMLTAADPSFVRDRFPRRRPAGRSGVLEDRQDVARPDP